MVGGKYSLFYSIFLISFPPCRFRYFDNNIIETIADGLFDNLNSLEYLYGQNNLLTHFQALNSQPIKEINLASNLIETFGEDAFSNLASLSLL